VDTSDDRYLEPNMMCLAKRHALNVDLEELDNEIKSKYHRSYAALMFEFELNDVEEEYGAEFGINLKFKAVDMIRPAFIKSVAVTDFKGDLWLFKNSKDALMAALDMKAILT
jgi:hypothetical protein